jgi:S1-C subfamily serine protease
MTTIDWAIVALAAVMAPIGYRQGLLVAGLGFGGFAAGAVLGARLAPLLLEEGSASPYAPGVALAGGLILGAGMAVIAQGLAVGLRDRLPIGFTTFDSIGGAVAFIVLALALAWVAGALALTAPALRGVREDVQRSVILGAVNDVLPPSGPILNVLHRIESTPELAGPNADVAAPGKGIVSDPDVVAAGGSVVQVLGTACGLNVVGSGWVAAPGVVVTNAHVIAGQEDTRVATRDGAELDATPTFYDPENDLAVLDVEGLTQVPLPLAKDPRSGTEGAVLGFPGGGDFAGIPARLGTTGEVTSEDSYGNGPIQRRMTSFRGEVVTGNSGGPFIDGRGRVGTTVFAATISERRAEGLGIPNDIVRDGIDDARHPVSTSSC